mmetsp:Transcript_28266/g.92984  ORF Transcript_28266/g.92984 Transcript_28266/m.92984 type:complete len:209 (-) Transcript_28266:840-1466(-)
MARLVSEWASAAAALAKAESAPDTSACDRLLTEWLGYAPPPPSPPEAPGEQPQGPSPARGSCRWVVPVARAGGQAGQAGSAPARLGSGRRAAAPPHADRLRTMKQRCSSASRASEGGSTPRASAAFCACEVASSAERRIPSDCATSSLTVATSPSSAKRRVIISRICGNWSAAKRVGAVARPCCMSESAGLPRDSAEPVKSSMSSTTW